MTDCRQLLADYAQKRSEPAFRELVVRYIDLVYSSALRLVDGDAHRAKDVAQIVFANLARKAGELSPDVMLGGWLHRHTCFVAANMMRGERRRLAREREAAEMNSLKENAGADFTRLAPLLDETINQLGEPDRTAILLRFFEQKDFRAVGQSLDTSEDAARMRVNRALEKLRDLLARRGIRTTAGALGIVITANAVQSAPIGLAAAISAAVTGAAVITTSTVVTATKTIAMTTLQKALVATTVAILAGAGVYEAHQASQLNDQVQTFKQQQAPLAKQVQQLQADLGQATNTIAWLNDEMAQNKTNNLELLKLRGELSLLKTAPTNQEANASKPSKKQEEINSIFKQVQSLGAKANLAYAVEGRLMVWKQHLQLTPDQQAMMRNILRDKYVTHNIFSCESKTLDPDIANILTPEQRTAAEELTLEEWQRTRNSQIAMGAMSDLNGLQFFLGMNKEQQEKALPILEEYQAGLLRLADIRKTSQTAQPLWGVEPYSKEFKDQKLDSLKSILSPEQFQILKAHEESMLEATRLQNIGNQINAEE